MNFMKSRSYFVHGDRVRLKNHAFTVHGTVIDVKRAKYIYSLKEDELLVKYDNAQLVPQQDWHSETELELIQEVAEKQEEVHMPDCKEREEGRCQCGALSLGYTQRGPEHSDYCKMHEVNYE